MSLHEIVYNVSATSTNGMLPPLENFRNYSKTIFVKNNSTVNAAEVQLLISPNGVDWVEESSFQMVNPGKTIFMIQGIIAKYFTVAYRSQGGRIKLTIWLDCVAGEQCLVKGKNIYMGCITCQVGETGRCCRNCNHYCENCLFCCCSPEGDDMEVGISNREIDVSLN